MSVALFGEAAADELTCSKEGGLFKSEFVNYFAFNVIIDAIPSCLLIAMAIWRY